MHYLEGLRENDDKAMKSLIEFRRLWELGEKQVERPDVKPAQSAKGTSVEMQVLCSGGGYIPVGLQVERG